MPRLDGDAFALVQIVVLLAERTSLVQGILNAKLDAGGVLQARVFRQIEAVFAIFTAILREEVFQTILHHGLSDKASVVGQEVVLLAVAASKALKRKLIILDELYTVLNYGLVNAAGLHSQVV